MKLKIEIPEERRRESFHLKESSLVTLREYTHFYSKQVKRAVAPDLVMDTLIQNYLEKDGDFKKWRKARKKEETTTA